MLLLEYGFQSCTSSDHCFQVALLLPWLQLPQDIPVVRYLSLLFSDPYSVIESPNKQNISYVVNYMKKKSDLSNYFSCLADDILENVTGATRTIIYRQTIKQYALVYTTIKILLGEKIYEDPIQEDVKRVLLEMLHSCTSAANKQDILESFQSDTGCVRILVATIAFRMGVDWKQVHQTVHFGPAKIVEAYMQETGRAGRDGKHSTAYLLYQSAQLTPVDKDIKNWYWGQYIGCEERREQNISCMVAHGK